MEAFVQKQKWNGTSMGFTLILFVNLVAVAVCAVFIGGTSLLLPTAIPLLAVMSVVSGCALYFMPLRLYVDDDVLGIAFSVRHKVFLLSDIASVKPYIRDKGVRYSRFTSGPMMRAGNFSSALVFGWWGWFSNREWGKFFVYATEIDHLLVIELENGHKYVVSSPDPYQMADEISRRMKKSR